LTDVRLTGGLSLRNKLFGLADFIAELKLSGALQAQIKDCLFTVSAVDTRLGVGGDRDLLLSAVGNPLQNAFKFTQPGTEVILNAVLFALPERIVNDELAGQSRGLSALANSSRATRSGLPSPTRSTIRLRADRAKEAGAKAAERFT